MSREQYLKKLRALIRELPNDERRTVIDFYREILADKVENGKSESEAVAELGDVHMLAQKILAENPNRRHYDGNRIAGIVLATVFGVAIVAAVVANALNLADFRGAASGYAQSAGGAETPEEKNDSAPVSGIHSIYVDARNRGITVERGDGDQIEFRYQADARDQFTFTAENGEMKLVHRRRGQSGLFNFSDFLYDRGPITVRVPERYAGEVTLRTTNGGISVDAMPHVTTLSCDTGNAEVSVTGVQAETVKADTSNGRIRLEGVTASGVEADTSNGEIRLKDLTCPDIDLKTSNGGIQGNILGREEDYTIRTDTSNGDCSPGSRQGGDKKLTANTSNANIRLVFSE